MQIVTSETKSMLTCNTSVYTVDIFLSRRLTYLSLIDPWVHKLVNVANTNSKCRGSKYPTHGQISNTWKHNYSQKLLLHPITNPSRPNMYDPSRPNFFIPAIYCSVCLILSRQGEIKRTSRIFNYRIGRL